MESYYRHEYICLDSNWELRSKAMITKDYSDQDIKRLPVWNIDGSSIGLAKTEDSEIMLKPVCMIKDPFHTGFRGSTLVMCETVTPKGYATVTNTREQTEFAHLEPWFGLELEFCLRTREGEIAWQPAEGQGPYYCGVGSENCYKFRACVDAMEAHALYAGLPISGSNGEVAPGQWEIQLGIVKGGLLMAGDYFYLLKYIIKRTAEEFELEVNFNPKPLGPKYNGSGCHVNFSSRKMRRSAGNLEVFNQLALKIEQQYSGLIPYCGKDNNLRMTGEHETANLGKFTWGVGNRAASLRIPSGVVSGVCGYAEFRVPNCYMDCYTVLSKLSFCMNQLQ